MSVQFTIDPSQKLVIATYSGEIKDSDILETGALIKSHPQFDPSFSELVDLSGVTSGGVSTSALEELARRESIYNRASKHVVIAPQPHLFGLTRMFEAYAQETKPNIMVVRTIEEGREFLGVHIGSVDPNR